MNTPNSTDTKPSWIKRFGLAAFLFFFIKGLLWLAAFYGLGKWLGW